MSSELELAGLPVSFASTKVTKKKSEINRKKKAQKKQNKKKKNHQSADSDSSENYNYAEEFKILEVLKEYKNPFTILMPKSERFKTEEEEEEDDEFFKSSCELDYGFEVASVSGPTEETVSPSSNPLTPSDLLESMKVKGSPLHKYYHQRYDYFSLFDSGVQIDEEGWYSVTPETIADHIAREAHAIALTNQPAEPSVTIILDAFCGVGGNTIQFAKYFDKVIAVDLDSGRLEMARHNASIYGVVDKIQFIHGDVFKVLPELKDEGIDLVFMSPPWGGPDYINRPVFCPRSDLMGNRGQELFDLGRSISKNLILFLPRQCDIFSVAEMYNNTHKKKKIKDDDSFVVEQHWLRNRLKAISIYFY